jgi:hypothetical protein
MEDLFEELADDRSEHAGLLQHVEVRREYLHHVAYGRRGLLRRAAVQEK